MEGSSYFSPIVICRFRVEMKNSTVSMFPWIIYIPVTFSLLTIKILFDQTYMFVKAFVGSHAFFFHYCYYLWCIYMFPWYISFFLGFCFIDLGTILYPLHFTFQNMFFPFYIMLYFAIKLVIHPYFLVDVFFDFISQLRWRHTLWLHI